MAGAGNVKTKQKRTKLTLDRLLSIKKYITDSLSVLAKHDKASTQIERNNTVPKGTGKTVYKKVAKNDPCGNNSSFTGRTIPFSDQCTGQSSNPACYFEEVSSVTSAQNVLQRIQTWPHDEYSTQTLEDQFSNQDHSRFRLQVFESPTRETASSQCQSPGPVGLTSSTQTNRTLSVRNQAIQTDMNDECDINADIIRYLSQFNDKIAFSVYAPTVFRKCGNGYPYYHDQDYCVYGNPHSYTRRRPARLSPRRQEEYIQLPARDSYAHNSMYRPTYDPLPSLAYHEPSWQCGLGISGDQWRQQAFEKALPTTSEFSLAKNTRFLAPSRGDTRVSSEDSGSILSSETDSDFMFYPCSSLTQNFQCMSMIDSRSSSYLSPPPDLPENVSTHFSWRTGFYGSSLDELTLQFFLDEDALSDDVFLDENEIISQADIARDNVLHDDTERSPESASMYSRLYDISPQSDPDCVPNPEDDTEFRDSYGDNCYAYRYADIDEVLNDCSNLDQRCEINETSDRDLSSEPLENGYIPSTNNSDTQLGDSHLEFNDEFSNVLDSLRRNSTQTKARKMWRQRRAKAKKNLKLRCDNNREQAKIPVCQPAFFTFDDININNHNVNFPPKPLRGILKNRDCISCKQLETESNQHPEEFVGSVDSSAEYPNLFVLDLNPRSHPGSPCVYASVHKRLNHTVKLSSVDEVAEVTTEPYLDQTEGNSHLETHSADNESTVSSPQSNSDNTRANFTDEQLQESGEHQSENPPLGEYNSDEFHVILSSDSDGRQRIFALRKNSIETYEWTRSLQRRQRKLVRRAKSCHNRLQNSECQIAAHKNGVTSSI